MANNTVSDLTTIAQPSDLTVTVTHGGIFRQGQTGATYALTVSNVAARSDCRSRERNRHLACRG
jgi:hypothetical protein